MADKVDDRIVSMQFDNATFERKLSQTIASLDKLRASLDFANSSRGLNELSNASKNFDMSDMGGKVEGVSNKFLALSTIAIATLATITVHAVETGARLLKAFTLTPILDGFREYETQLNSVQTILANTESKGTTLDQVNAALQKLNEYSDKTIYNFGQMAKNIGTFTAAGVDLDTSVNSIKGIANLAAVSGSSAEQASGAMYQLSQAIAAGSLKLIDWNSVVNSGMGGEVFKTALFETGKAMKTLTGVPVGQTLKEWEKANGSFRESLEQGWVTSDVLTTTLSAFTGDLTDAQLKAKGFTDTQIANIKKMAATAQGAATEVKTFTQLVGTVKEAVGTGWADSFKIVIGGFNEAKGLWTGVNNSIGAFVGKMSEARNKLLQGWKDLGGRNVLIDVLSDSFTVLARAVSTVTQGFRDIFPPMTAQRLFDLTKGFDEFVKRLIIGGETFDNLKRIFRGVFAALEIGWEIVKGVFGVIGDVIKALAPAGGDLLAFGGGVGDMVVRLNEALVAGGAIRRFFERLGEVVVKPIKFIQQLKDAIVEFFTVGIGEDAVSNSIDRIGARADAVRTTWDKMMERFQGVFRVLDKVWEYISTWFSELGQKIADAFHPGDFDAAVDIVNVGLLGGIALLLRRFIQNGISLDFAGGLIDKIHGIFGELTNTLKAMQTSLKADALLKIAGALGILTASIVVLSLIDSGALTKALTAITVGFGQLVGVMTLLDKVVGSVGAAAKISILSTAFIGLATSMVILAAAIRVLSGLGWTELAKGLVGVGVGLGLMVAAVNLITSDTAGLIRAGASMILIATGLRILANAVEAFSTMSWGEIAKGLVAVGAGLLVIVTAMNFMPPSSVLSGLGFIAVAAGLRILVEAVEAFGDLSWKEIGKGLAGIAGGLIAIGLAMNLMPVSMAITGPALVVVAAGLVIMAEAVKRMGEIAFGDLAKGIGAFAAMLIILSAAMIVMSASASGAPALLITSAALLILANVLEKIGDLSIAQIVTGILAIAAALAVLGGASILLAGTIPTLLGLGIAINLLGVGFALFGAGAFLVAKGLEAIAKSGAKGAKAIVEIIKVFVTARYEIVKALAEAIIGLAEELLKAIPLLVRLMQAVLMQLLETVVELAPEIAMAIAAIVTQGLALIRFLFPQFVETGYQLLLAFMRGIRDHIGEIVTVGTEIIVNFVSGLINNMPTLILAATNLIISFLTELGNHVGELVGAGLKLLSDFLLGIAQNIGLVIQAVITIITTIVEEIGRGYGKILQAGVDLVVEFLKGIGRDINKVLKAGTDLAISILDGAADNAVDFVGRAAKVLIKFLDGLRQAIDANAPAIREAGLKLAGSIINAVTGGLAEKAKDAAGSVLDVGKSIGGGLLGGAKKVLGIFSPSKEFMKLGDFAIEGLALGVQRNSRAEDNIADMAQRIVDNFSETLSRIPNLVKDMDDFNPVIRPVLDLTSVQKDSRGIAGALGTDSIRPDVSFNAARGISSASSLQDADVSAAPSGPTEIKFEQNNYSPKALTSNDIYRSTKSQIALAKEELNIT